jgi:YebC/PmpR family DNA-binding regulatory protein
MPNDNVDRAIKKGTGEGGSAGQLEEVTYEGYGPSNVALIIDCTTDNRNRTVGDLRSTIEKLGGRFAENGAVSWQFKTIGRILLEFENDEEKKLRENAKWNDKLDTPKLSGENAEEFELSLYDLPGVLDVKVEPEGMEINTEYSELNNVKKFIDEKGYKIADAEIIKVSANQITLTDEEAIRVEEFIEKIEDFDDVQKVWSNLAE